MTFTTNEPITGFELDDLIVINGMASDFVEVSPQEYTALITPTIAVNANITVDVNAGAGMDTATNPTLAAGQFSIAFDDIRPLVCFCLFVYLFGYLCFLVVRWVG